MKILNNKNLIAYASAFVSYIIPKVEVEEIILFGSSARGEITSNSDIDLFFNTKKNEEETKKRIKVELERFYKTKIYEIWKLKENVLPIHIEVGDLEKWSLKRSIISDGIVLYGKYKSIPKKTRGLMFFNIPPIKNITKRNRIIRLLFGRKEQNYNKKGLVEKLNGKRLSSSSFIVPIEKSNEMIKLLNSEKIVYSLFEFWTDQI